MAEMIFFNGFLKSRSKISSERIRKKIDEMLYTIKEMPGVGSTLSVTRRSIGRRGNIRKAIVKPYVIVYEYDETKDIVYIHDLMHGSTIR